MKIMHASLPSDHPRRTAEVLASILGGEALPFPPGGPDSWMAWSADGAIELEVVRRGDLLAFEEEQGNWRPVDQPQRLSECHLAIGIERAAGEILAIARAVGWPARLCARGGGLFELVEIWVDGCFMLELFDPAQTARYEQAVTPASWKRILSDMMPA